MSLVRSGDDERDVGRRETRNSFAEQIEPFDRMHAAEKQHDPRVCAKPDTASQTVPNADGRGLDVDSVGHDGDVDAKAERIDAGCLCRRCRVQERGPRERPPLEGFEERALPPFVNRERRRLEHAARRHDVGNAGRRRRPRRQRRRPVPEAVNVNQIESRGRRVERFAQPARVP